ncbi:methyltransferase domain-containing protein [Phenylobacterium sp.]|uniref:methyltransferase domain-containing protein n=1 Tax=Phenylobacterium sp. TaxID=1871053 RepID=UPI002DEBF559|nr:methyltransferase domain-containing protein [Phenylobacterium sp.]
MNSLNHQIASHLKKVAGEWPAEPDTVSINAALRVMSRWRQFHIVESYLRRHGTIIWGGPFRGMDYVATAAEGALMPRLLGSYEGELHPHLRAFAEEDLEVIIDVGCAEGYYAVGLARLMPQVTVHARDIDEKALQACRALADKNGVGERVIVGGEFQPQDFEAFAGRRGLVMVDAEGAELDVLQPELSPALAGLSLIVETHDIYRAGCLATLQQRFAPTHDIVVVEQQYLPFDPPPWFAQLPHLDRMLAVWEWRVSPTPWLVMRPKAG